jgi:hypothetical protein
LPHTELTGRVNGTAKQTAYFLLTDSLCLELRHLLEDVEQ